MIKRIKNKLYLPNYSNIYNYMADNKGLHKASKAKKDEFYTQLVDIENELRHYKSFFKDKVVLCNCDDPRVSNFFRYFTLNFEFLGLKKVISTCYKSNNPDLFSENTSEQAIWIEYTGDKNGNSVPDVEEMEIHSFKGDGDFRSKECIELLKQADVVVTNPPFSLFREFVAQLIEYDKKFIIIGHQNALSYKEIFPLIQNNQMWLGYGFKGGAGHFISQYEDTAKAGDHKEGMIRVSGVVWFTNVDIEKLHEPLVLYKSYSPDSYPKYENFNAINVDKTTDIPFDYDGIMGVPITFIDKYCPEQFEIVGLGIANLGLSCGVQPYKPEHKKYRKEVQKRGVVDGDLYMMINGEVTVPYARILIKRK